MQKLKLKQESVPIINENSKKIFFIKLKILYNQGEKRSVRFTESIS